MYLIPNVELNQAWERRVSKHLFRVIITITSFLRSLKYYRSFQSCYIIPFWSSY